MYGGSKNFNPSLFLNLNKMNKILKQGYCNLMLSYYVDYLNAESEKIREYFDSVHERSEFIINNKT